MLQNGKILWKEGMFLEPHHFQQFDRLQAAHVNARAGSLVYGGFQHGFTELKIDRDALLSGNFLINRAAGVFPDGSCFDIGGGASKSLLRSFAAYCRADQQTLDVYLAIPVDATVTGSDQYVGVDDGMSDGRYIERTILAPDDFLSDNSKEIEIGEPNYQIRFAGEPLDGCIWLRIARLTRTGSSYMESAHDYSPPVLFMRVSDVLKSCVSGLLELLWARINSLARHRSQNESGQAFFTSAQENSFRLLNTLCTFTPLLGRLHELPKIHPFEYYMQLTALYGSLLSFSPSISFENFPSFDHDDPSSSFIALAERIRELLKVEFWADCTMLELEQVNASTWFGRFPHEGFAASVNLFIGVSAKMPQKELMIDVLQRMKVASKDKLDMLISSSLPGLALIHARNIPEGLAAKPDYVYFVVDRQGALWEAVEMSGALGVHFSGGSCPELKIEVLALKHRGGSQ
ncbi:MAG: type VI secretion system baseplate subunit TssK [Chitinispirillales bacterium]|jgi:type VI secretion system protein ImpJ|nr:type VI secretion system baseplate subunit TssK [Chitinispirillales bacterium]